MWGKKNKNESGRRLWGVQRCEKSVTTHGRKGAFSLALIKFIFPLRPARLFLCPQKFSLNTEQIIAHNITA